MKKLSRLIRKHIFKVKVNNMCDFCLDWWTIKSDMHSNAAHMFCKQCYEDSNSGFWIRSL